MPRAFGPAAIWLNIAGSSERHQPPWMNKASGALVVILGREQVDGLPRRRSVGDAELGASRAACAIGRRFALPARENLRMLGHPAAIVVFYFVVDGHVESRARSLRWSRSALRRAETTLSLSHEN